jgi:hypothetical protein
MAKDIIKVNHHFIDWLQQSYPSLKEELDTELNALTESSSASKG